MTTQAPADWISAASQVAWATTAALEAHDQAGNAPLAVRIVSKIGTLLEYRWTVYECGVVAFNGAYAEAVQRLGRLAVDAAELQAIVAAGGYSVASGITGVPATMQFNPHLAVVLEREAGESCPLLLDPLLPTLSRPAKGMRFEPGAAIFQPGALTDDRALAINATGADSRCTVLYTPMSPPGARSYRSSPWWASQAAWLPILATALQAMHDRRVPRSVAVARGTLTSADRPTLLLEV